MTHRIVISTPPGVGTLADLNKRAETSGGAVVTANLAVAHDPEAEITRLFGQLEEKLTDHDHVDVVFDGMERVSIEVNTLIHNETDRWTQENPYAPVRFVLLFTSIQPSTPSTAV